MAVVHAIRQGIFSLERLTDETNQQVVSDGHKHADAEKLAACIELRRKRKKENDADNLCREVCGRRGVRPDLGDKPLPGGDGRSGSRA